jgi:hypothetical protein
MAEPALVIKAKELGLWPEGIRFEILTERNPYYLRGDFNGDGVLDVAIQARDTSNREKGLVIVHGTLDTLHTLFESTVGRGPIYDGRHITVIRKGSEIRPWPGQADRLPPFVLIGDAIRSDWGGPYSGAFYWKAGKYHWVTLSD